MIITRTPYRVSFFGGGTDYPSWYLEHGGAVLGTTIDKFCYISCRYLPPFFPHHSRVVYGDVENVDANEQIKHPAVNAILRYLDVRDGLEIHHDGDLPARSGIASSSAFTVGLLNAIYALRGVHRSKGALANDAIEVEQQWIGENVGSQDQTLTAHGGLNRVRFRPSGAIEVEPVIISAARRAELQSHLLLFFSGTVRVASLIASRYIEAAHTKPAALEEIGGMVDEGLGLLSGSSDICEFGRLLHHAWEVKRSLADVVSTSKIDEAYDAAIRAGAVGGKILGAGGGGFLLIFAPPEAHAEVIERLTGGMVHVPFRFEDSGSQVIYSDHRSAMAERTSRPSNGRLQAVPAREEGLVSWGT